MFFLGCMDLSSKVSICMTDWTGKGTNGFGVGGRKEGAVWMGEEGAGTS